VLNVMLFEMLAERTSCARYMTLVRLVCAQLLIYYLLISA